MKYRASSLLLILTLTIGTVVHADRPEPFGLGYRGPDYNSVYVTVKTLADQGDVNAQYELGRMFENGQSVAKNDQLAVAWYRKAAEQGHAEAQASLGVLYARGYGVPRNDPYAVFWFRKAADQGLAKAQYDLAYMYSKGLGTPRDDQQAIDWYKKAAGQGVVRAQYNLGEIYSKGVGVPKDEQEAYFWWLLASAQGFPQAVEKRNFLELRLSAEQRAGGQALARSWIPKTSLVLIQPTQK